MKIHIIQHESFESTAAFDTWTQNKNHEVSYTKVFQGDTLPQTPDFDFLIVMGGSQCPATTVEECSYFDTKKEISFIKNAIDHDKIVLGVCLGAQLIGEALGAKYHHSPNSEIGVFEVSLTDAGTKDPIISQFPNNFLVGHWHNDMPGLTDDTEILATSDGCPRQIVRYSQKVYGFQCHFEFNLDAIKGMIKNCPADLEKSSQYIQNEQDMLKQDYEPINKLLFKFLDYMEDTYS